MNKKEFEKIDRKPVTLDEFTSFVRQILSTPVSARKSENREPTREELNRKWKLVRK